MICTCIQIHRDINGKIVGYTVRDLSGNTRTVTPTELKSVIKSGSLEVNNLTLTKDGRLLSKKADNFDNTNLLTQSGLHRHRDSFVVNGRVSFDKWLNNFLNKLHARVGGNMRLVEKSEDNGYVYTHLYWKFENIRRSGVKTHSVDIIINLLPTRKTKLFVRMVDDESGDILVSSLNDLNNTLYRHENTKIIESTVKDFLKKYKEYMKG